MPPINDPNTNPIPGTAQVVSQSEAVRTIVEMLRILVDQFCETVQDPDDEQVGEQLINLMKYQIRRCNLWSDEMPYIRKLADKFVDWLESTRIL